MAPEIYIYLTPDPFESDDCLEEDNFSWIPGYLSGEDEDGTVSFLREENTELFDKIFESFKGDISAALQRLKPLFDEFYLRQLNVALDFSGLLTRTKSSLAGYYYHYSQPSKGIYSFSVDQNMLYRKALFLRDAKKSVLPDMNLWEHELIHLFDHQELVAASLLKESEIGKNNLDYYCLKFREEGLANLFDLLDGKLKDISGVREAKEKFVSAYRIAAGKLMNEKNTTSEIRKEVYKGFDFYEIGPWLILAILHRDFSFSEDDLDIQSIFEKLTLGVVVEDAVKIKLLKRATYIDNQYFLSAVSNWLTSDSDHKVEV